MATYSIQSGDNLTKIAQQNNTTIDALLKANPDVTNPDRIYAGSTLMLPDSPAIPTAAPTAAPAPTPSTTPNGTHANGVSAPDYANIAQAAGEAGIDFNGFQSFLGATPDEQTAAKDALAKQFGYDGYDSFLKEIFAKPSKTTEQFYNDAYSSAGLDAKLAEIAAKKNSLNEAMGTVNANPWYDEAYRRGEAKRLQDLANPDIQNLIDEYNLRHDKVKELVARHSEDVGQDEKIRDARFNYLESAAKERADAVSTQRMAQYLTNYVEGKTASAIPKTVTAPDGSAIYQWDETTKEYKLLKAATPKTEDLLGGLTKDQRTYLNQIQDNSRQDKNISEFPAVRASYETARSAATKRDGTGDIVLMRMLAKITDPTTGVREEEFQTFQSAQSTLARFGIQLTSQMWSGDRLTDAGRTALLQAAQDIYDQRQAAYLNSYNFYNRQATDAGLPDGTVMPKYLAPGSAGESSASGGAPSSWANFLGG